MRFTSTLFLLAATTSNVLAANDESTNLRRKAYILPEKEEEHRYFVQYKQGKKMAARSFLNQRSATTRLLFDFEELDSFVVSTTDENDIDQLRSNPNIRLLQRDEKRYPQYLESSIQRSDADTNRRLQQEQETPYGITMVNAPEVWPEGETGAGVKVCVIDTGMDAAHEDFNTLSGLDGVPNLPWTVDAVGHGTHCSGTIAAANNDKGVVGVAPDAEIYTVRVFGDNGLFAYSSGLIAAALECESAGAKVISMSLGGPLPNIFEFLAYRGLMDRGVMTVAAAGNFGNFLLSFPASYSGVMSVAAIDEQKQHAPFSQFNFQVDIAAPGVNVKSTFPTTQPCSICESVDEYQYGTISGTSMATPHVAGVAALLVGAFPEVEITTIMEVMEETAEDLGEADRDDYFGHGLVDAKAAYDKLKELYGTKTEEEMECGDGEILFSLRMQLDDKASETSWALQSLVNEEPLLSGSGYQNGQTVTVQECIPDDCYSFVLADSGEDGMCCDNGKGSYSLSVGDNVVVEKGGNFGAADVLAFGSCAVSPEMSMMMEP